MIDTLHTIRVLGFPTTTLDRRSLLSEINRWITARDASRHLMALNPIKVIRARSEADLVQHILQADMVYPDAFGISWAMSVFSGNKFKPIPGCDLMLDLFAMAAQSGYKIFLLGASETVVAETAQYIKSNHPGAYIAGFRHGYFSSEDEKQKTVQQIVDARPDMVFVAMGALIQENWIQAIQKACTHQNISIPLLMGVGGSFDAITGHVPRPPKWMLQLHLEWLFRLLQQPFRAPRMLALPKFAILVLMKKWFGIDTDVRIVELQKK